MFNPDYFLYRQQGLLHRQKGKKTENLGIYIAQVVLSKRSVMNHTVLPANYTMPVLPS